MDATAQAYSDAFEAIHGERPKCKLIGARYSVVTRTGFFADYTKRDIQNITRGLRALADLRKA